MHRARRLIALCCVTYPCLLLLLLVALQYGAGRFWQIELALYAPRLLFAAPLPALVLLLLVFGLHRLLWSQVVAAAIIAFPLMGLAVHWPSRGGSEAAFVRVLSYNANFAAGGAAALAKQVLAFSPDIAVFQQLFFGEELTTLLRVRYPVIKTNGEFLFVSRLPLESAVSPDDVWTPRRQEWRRFVRYSVRTEWGSLIVYNMHPVSPRYQVYAARRGGLRRAIASGQIFSTAKRPDIESDSELRAVQVNAVADMARRESLPVIIAGDTNLPTLSYELRALAGFQDGFSTVGLGFGYTFPSHRPWMRLDRVFANSRLRFVRFQVGRQLASDHLCVVADLDPAD